jgi:hypothetical protein
MKPLTPDLPLKDRAAIAQAFQLLKMRVEALEKLVDLHTDIFSRVNEDLNAIGRQCGLTRDDPRFLN